MSLILNSLEPSYLLQYIFQWMQFSVLLDIYPRVKLLGHILTLFNFLRNSQTIKWMHNFTFSSVMYESSIFPTSLRIIGLCYLVMVLIFISLVTKWCWASFHVLGHLYYFSGKCLFNSLIHFLIVLLVFVLWSCKSPLYILYYLWVFSSILQLEFSLSWWVLEVSFLSVRDYAFFSVFCPVGVIPHSSLS